MNIQQTSIESKSAAEYQMQKKNHCDGKNMNSYPLIIRLAFSQLIGEGMFAF
jgi:hypothetical protein